MSEIEMLEERLFELSKLYHMHWGKVCAAEGAQQSAIAVEFSAGNTDAIACVEIYKEMNQIKHALKSNIIRRYDNAKIKRN